MANQGPVQSPWDADLTVHYVIGCSFETTTTNVLTQQSLTPCLSCFAAALLVEIGPGIWSEKFGTHFVAGFVWGGQFIGKASFTSGSQELALKLKGSLEAEFGCFGSGQANTGAQRKESLVSQFVAADVLFVSTAISSRIVN